MPTEQFSCAVLCGLNVNMQQYTTSANTVEFGYDYWTKKPLKFDLTFPANQDFVLVLINYINRRVKNRHGVYTLKLLLRVSLIFEHVFRSF